MVISWVWGDVLLPPNPWGFFDTMQPTIWTKTVAWPKPLGVGEMIPLWQNRLFLRFWSPKKITRNSEIYTIDSGNDPNHFWNFLPEMSGISWFFLTFDFSRNPLTCPPCCSQSAWRVYVMRGLFQMIRQRAIMIQVQFPQREGWW